MAVRNGSWGWDQSSSGENSSCDLGEPCSCKECLDSRPPGASLWAKLSFVVQSPDMFLIWCAHD